MTHVTRDIILKNLSEDKQYLNNNLKILKTHLKLKEKYQELYLKYNNLKNTTFTNDNLKDFHLRKDEIIDWYSNNLSDMCNSDIFKSFKTEIDTLFHDVMLYFTQNKV